MAKEGRMFTSTETYEVKRPFQQVADTYKQRASQCINQTVQTRIRQGGAIPTYMTEIRAYKATVIATNKCMECALQSRVVGGNVHELGMEGAPKDGYYYTVVDAFPVDAGTTRIVVSKSMPTTDALLQAFKNWATGESMGCPDLTQ